MGVSNMEQLLPVMLLKGLILLPNQEVKIELSNNISKEIIKLASKKYNRKVLVITPHNQIEESPEVQDLPDVGVIGKIKSKIELPNGNIRITLKGETRVKIVMFSNNTENEDILEASITDIKLPKFDEVEQKAIIKKLNEIMQEYVVNSSHVSNSILSTIKVIDDLSLLTDTICSFIPLSFHKRLEYVEELNAMYRAKSLLKDILVELEVVKLDKKIEHELESSLEQSQKEFILREKDANTPSKRVYFIVQQMYLSKNVEELQKLYIEYVRDLQKAAPSLIPYTSAITDNILRGDYYSAIKSAAVLTKKEDERDFFCFKEDILYIICSLHLHFHHTIQHH